jgi:Transglutaminase-like superfamily
MRHATVSIPMHALALASACVAACATHAPSAAVEKPIYSSAPLPPLEHVVTADIQTGIEAHVDEQVTAGEGYFNLPYEDRTLKLRLVRVHTEYLANLGPEEHFACVDLVDAGGDVFDVDFFMKGKPGAMVVTGTTVHKKNGQPFYAWEQAEDRTWQRVPVDPTKPEQLGVLLGEDTFVFIYRVTLPKLSEPARMWLPLPASDAVQTVSLESKLITGREREVVDAAHGNRVLFLELGPQDSEKSVELRWRVTRKEKAIYEGDAEEAKRFLAAETLVPATKSFADIASEVTAGKKGEIVRARALYDHVIDQMRYMKYGDGWGKGDATYACDLKTGNCTDFHSYFIAIARAAGIPARFAIGAAIPSERNEGGIDGYHCWAEFYAEGKWWPIDISEGDKYSSLATYYFGHHPANRIEMSRGRDLRVDPAPASGPINFLAYPLLEVGGRVVRAKAEFAFERRR